MYSSTWRKQNTTWRRQNTTWRKFKLKPRKLIILGIEVGVRYTFSDELDGSVPDAEYREPFSFGNINSNDWYVFSGFTITYTFGEKPCYCSY